MDMRQKARQGIKFARGAADRRLGGRLGLLASALVLLVLANAAPAAAWWGGNGKVTKVTPEEGCPGDPVVIEGERFKSNQNQLRWSDPFNQNGSWGNVTVNG